MNCFDLNEIEYPGVEQRGKAGDMTCFATEKRFVTLQFPFYQEMQYENINVKGSTEGHATLLTLAAKQFLEDRVKSSDS